MPTIYIYDDLEDSLVLLILVLPHITQGLVNVLIFHITQILGMFKSPTNTWKILKLMWNKSPKWNVYQTLWHIIFHSLPRATGFSIAPWTWAPTRRYRCHRRGCLSRFERLQRRHPWTPTHRGPGWHGWSMMREWWVNDGYMMGMTNHKLWKIAMFNGKNPRFQ